MPCLRVRKGRKECRVKPAHQVLKGLWVKRGRREFPVNLAHLRKLTSALTKKAHAAPANSLYRSRKLPVPPPQPQGPPP